MDEINRKLGGLECNEKKIKGQSLHNMSGILVVLDVDMKVKMGDMKIQALRSASQWSLGKQSKEDSIYQCYLETIKRAERFIFIENQFIISSTSESGVSNTIIQEIVNRISIAHENSENFRVIIFLPLLPAFEANLEEEDGAIMQAQIGLQTRTIGKGPNSLIEQVKSIIENTHPKRYRHGHEVCPEDYVLFFSLRNWGKKQGKVSTEIVYIHSKVYRYKLDYDSRR